MGKRLRFFFAMFSTTARSLLDDCKLCLQGTNVWVVSPQTHAHIVECGALGDKTNSKLGHNIPTSYRVVIDNAAQALLACEPHSECLVQLK